MEKKLSQDMDNLSSEAPEVDHSAYAPQRAPFEEGLHVSH